MSAIPEGERLMSTVDLRIDYISPAPGRPLSLSPTSEKGGSLEAGGVGEGQGEVRPLICEAKVVHKKRTFILSDVSVYVKGGGSGSGSTDNNRKDTERESGYVAGEDTLIAKGRGLYNAYVSVIEMKDVTAV